MNGLFAPMVVKYNMKEYATVGIVSPALPTTLKFKVEKKTVEETHLALTSEGPMRVEFLLQPINPDQYDKNFVIAQAINCEFVRFLEQCVMCRAPKLEGGP